MRVFLVIFGLAALPLFAEPAGNEAKGKAKAAWEWTLEERLAVRFDPQRTAETRKLRASISSSGEKAWGVVAGDDTPELFLPIELFTALMSGVEGDAEFREAYRSTLRDRIIDFGLDDETFWQELENAGSNHIRLIRQHQMLTKRVAEVADAAERAAIMTDTEELQPALCQSRFTSLENARKHFGRETFDRFLYTLIAPDLEITAVAPSAATAEHLRFLSGGCR